jgi:hypothetical protein
MGQDVNQPAVAADYIKMGADPATAETLAQQCNILTGRSGTRDQRIDLEVGMRNQPPPAKPAPPASKVTPADAIAALHAHENAALSQELSAVMAPPASPSDYQFPSRGDLSDAQFATDNEIKTALHSEGFPRQVVDSIASDIATAVATHANETQQQAQARIAGTRATLERWYGKDTDANLNLVDGVLARLIAKGGATRSFVENVASHLNALSIDQLVQFAKYRASRR